jgi:hypothetical protein
VPVEDDRDSIRRCLGQLAEIDRRHIHPPSIPPPPRNVCATSRRSGSDAQISVGGVWRAR